ncbi:MAG TPA: hypothetical protein VK639_00275 [Terriglobales bacterium]|nr:hypothetical protein [Terriglobales bacterium]
MNTTKMSGGIEYARRHFLSVAAMGLAAEKTKKQNKQPNGDMKRKATLHQQLQSLRYPSLP